MSQNHGRDHAVDQRPEHDPAEPDSVTEKLDRSDGWMLRLDQLKDGIAKDVYTEPEQGNSTSEISHQHRPTVAIRKVLVRILRTKPNANEERYQRYQAEQVLDPHRLQCLRRTHDDRD